MERTRLRVRINQHLTGLVIAIVLACSGLLVLSLSILNSPRVQIETPTRIPQAEVDAVDVASSFVEAFTAVDYRLPGAWLESLRPLTTDRGFKMLEAVFVPTSWPLFERDKRVVPRECIAVQDKGIVVQGHDWQVRLMAVAVSSSPAAQRETSLQMRLLLTHPGSAWRVESILTEQEVERLLAASNGGME